MLVFLTNLTLSLIFVLTLIVCYFKWKYQYWQRRNLPFFEPEIPFGNLSKALQGKEHTSTVFKKLYDEMKRKKWKHGGIFMYDKPAYFPLHLDIIKNILTKDFKHFMDRDQYFNDKEPLQAHLVNLRGENWKKMRAKLTPVFTSGKIKTMFQIMVQCQNHLLQRMNSEILKKEPINIKEVLACFTTNIIGSCAFGIDCKALENEDSEFRKLGKKMFAATKFETFKRLLALTFPKVAKFLNVYTTKKEVKDFVIDMVSKTIEFREKNNFVRNDFMQLLIDLKNEDDGLDLNEIASQCLVFYAAGFETSSTLMTFILYELAKNFDIQEKLRSKINLTLEKHEISYEAIQEMKFLSQVINETLRLHPPAAVLNRKCNQGYQLPGLFLEKGTTVFISVLGIHLDEEYYPNPETFDPGRFSQENKGKRHNFAFMPFGEGPRNCIGMRFGLLQAKMGLVSLLKNFKFTLSSLTEEPLVYRPNSIVLTPRKDILLNVEAL